MCKPSYLYMKAGVPGSCEGDADWECPGWEVAFTPSPLPPPQLQRPPPPPTKVHDVTVVDIHHGPGASNVVPDYASQRPSEAVQTGFGGDPAPPSSGSSGGRKVFVAALMAIAALCCVGAPIAIGFVALGYGKRASTEAGDAMNGKPPVKRKKVGKGKGGKYARTADDLEEEDDDDIVEGEDLEVEAARIRKELSARPMLDDAPVAAEDDKPVPLAIRAPVDLDL